ncbi:MAG: hypothetical protein ABR500_01990 [Dermatophilaceae bacterium]|nr:hypothetical protein [Intrasporangiaceae bacterium]
MPQSPDRQSEPPDQDQQQHQAEGGRRVTVNRVILTVVGIVALVLLALLAASVLPRWWAQRMGTMVDGRLLVGGLLGIVMGMVFTTAPLVFFGVAARHLRSIGKAVSALLFGIALALPNLMTLAIVLGAGSAAHAGQRIFDVDGPGFRGGSLIGAILGAVFGAWIVYLMWSRRRRGRRLEQAGHAD